MKIGSVKLFERARYIGGKEDPLLIRWVLFRVPAFGIFLHKFCRSDHDRALHCHPWSFVSVILKNGYEEITESGSRRYGFGSILLRPAEWKHRVVISGKPSWSLILVGRRRRRWGFWPNGKFCWWRKYDTNLGICTEEIIWKGGND